MARSHNEAVRPNPYHNQLTTRLQREVANNDTNNPYAVPRGNKCYHCGQTGHYSNQYHHNRLVNLTTHDDDVEKDETYFENEEYIDEIEPEEVIYRDEGISLVI
ncbi:Zinc finger, CCHC-type, partial [Parasponia andersonii]